MAFGWIGSTIAFGAVARHLRAVGRYPTVYVGEQYWIVDIQAIEIIERRRMVAHGDGSIIWPSQG
jgi:hypothetical protein